MRLTQALTEFYVALYALVRDVCYAERHRYMMGRRILDYQSMPSHLVGDVVK